MTDNKKYIINIGDHSEEWTSDMYAEAADGLFADHKDANVFELEDVGDFDEDPTNRQYIINIGDHSEVWDGDMVKEAGASLKEEHPDVKIQRVSYKDYWGEQATANREQRALLAQPDQERNAKLADLGYYDDITGEAFSYTQSEEGVPQWGPSLGLQPLSSIVGENEDGTTFYADPKVAEFFAKDTSYTDRMAEIARLDAEYESNPAVIAQREWEAEWRAEQAKYAENLENQIRKDAKDAGHGNLERMQMRKAAPMLGMGHPLAVAQYNAMYADADLPDSEANNFAAALNMLELAKEARTVKDKKAWQALTDEAQRKFMAEILQPAGANYVKIGNILTRIEKEYGAVDEESLTPEKLDELLTKDEQALILSFMEYNAALADAQVDASTAYKGAQQFAKSVPFMLEMMVTGGLYNAAGKAATSKMTRSLMEWAAKKGAGKALRKFAAKSAIRLTYGAAGTLARTVVAPSTYKAMAEGAASSMDDEGHMHKFKGTVIKGLDKYIENFSEITGDAFGLVGKGLAKSLGKIDFGKFGKFLADSNFMQKAGHFLANTNDLLKQFGFHGFVGEIGEELIGSAIREVTLVQPGAMKEMFEGDNFGAMLIGFAPVSLFGAGMSAVSMGAMSIEAANLGKKLRETLSYHYKPEQIDHMMNLVSKAKNGDQVMQAITPLMDGLTKEEGQQLLQYGAFMAQNKAMLFAKKAQDDNLAQAKRAEFQQQYGNFWQTSEEGAESVQIAELRDGRTVFVTSAPNESGMVTIIDAETGKQGFSNVSEYAEQQDKEGNISQKTRTWAMDAFLESRIASERLTAQEARMSREYNEQVQNLQSQMTSGTKINLGTTGNPIWMVATGQTSKDGVFAVDSTGATHTIGWMQVADAMNQPIRVKTDQEIIDEEVAAVVARNAERRKKMRNATTAMTDAVNESAAQTAEVVAQESKHIPMNEDGTVNEAAFWEQDPEGYVQWNDEQNQDGGADSLQQVAITKAVLTSLFAEAQQAQQTSNPAERKAAKQRAQEIAEKINRLTAIEAGYAEQRIAPLRERAMKWKSLTNAPVYIVETEEDLASISGQAAASNKGGARVRGFAKDGRAYIYLPGIVEESEIDAVFMHEAVAHTGLKGLLGQQAFDELCDQVWEMMSPEMQTVFINYPGVNGNTRAAADEYIAHLAETMGAGIAEAEEKTIWQSIIDFVRNILRSMGIALNVSESELSDLIHMAYADLAKNMAEAEDIAVQQQEARVAEREAPSAARQEYDTYAEDLTHDEIKAVAANDFNAAQEAYNTLVGAAPKVEMGESAKDFIARKKAYNEQVAEAKAALDARQALMDEIARIDAANAPVLTDTKALEQEMMFSVKLTDSEIDNLVEAMKANAEVAEDLELTPENWEDQFGTDGMVPTPVGNVKMGENQYLKLLQRKRNQYFGMIRPTLVNPDIVLEELSPSENGERDTVLLFIKTFIKPDGSRYVHFESVTIQKDSMEISISSHEIQEGDLKKKMRNDKVAHLRDSLSASEWRLNGRPLDGSDLVPTPSDNLSDSKDSENLETPSESERFSVSAVRIDPDANQQAEGNVMFSTRRGSLVGMHNISEEKLRKLIKQGGSANPSTAVIDIERQSFDSYGDISLIMPSSLVDAETGRNAGTFTADAWTPTYPQIEKRFSDDNLQRAYWRDITAIPEEMQHEVRMAFDSWLDNRTASGLAYMYLLERGEAPEMVRVAAKFPQEIKDKMSAILGEGRTSFYKLTDEEKQAVLDLYIQENFGGSREDFDSSIAETIQRIEDRLSTGKVPSFVEKRITADLQWMKEHGYNYDNLSDFVRDIVSDIRHAGEVNDAATTNRALDYIKDNNLSAEYEQWKESLNDRYGIKEYLFGGYTPSGNPRWLPNTVENASKLMNKQGLAGATGMASSFNRFVATLAPKKKSLSDIRSSKDLLVEDEKLVDDFRDKWSEVFFDLGIKCQPDAKGYEDYGLERLTEAAQKKNPGAYLKKEYGVELSQDDLQRLADMIKAIKTEFPARYFETKFQRPVYLNEFAAAVMPTTTSEDVKQAVSKAGLPIFEYDSAVEGSRHEATLKATDMDSIRFSIANENQAIFVSNAARAVNAIKMEKATPEQWLKMIEKNGGLKAGEDKWMGLSEWLKASDKKTLTKQEVLDFINENMIIIEEEHYGESDLSALQEEFNEIYDGIIDNVGNEEEEDLQLWEVVMNPMERAWEELRERHSGGDDFDMAFSYDSHGNIEINDPDAAGYFLGVKPINDTRLDYTTSGLQNKQEIALVIPAIEPWNERDEVHFGDAGDGRAVAWIRFGETTATVQDETQQRLNEIYDRLAELEMKVSSSTGITHEEYEERSRLRKERDELQEIEPKTQRVLVIDEIQSKRHQDGREKGYRTSREDVAKATEAFQSFNRAMKEKYGENVFPSKWSEEDQAEFDRLRDEHTRVSKSYDKGIPDAPFEKNWHELAMKRMLRYAAEEGYDAIAWTKGEQQAERYGLQQVVDGIFLGAWDESTGTKFRPITLSFKDGHIDTLAVNEDGFVFDGTYKGSTLADVVGKDMAVRLMTTESRVIADNDLKIGGEGMKGFYDKMLPAFMNKYGKKWGIKVADITLPNVEKAGRVMHSVPVTDAMKESVMEGQVMFSAVQIDPAVRQEMDTIKAKAMWDGTFMKAPNGAETKLTEDQWLLVRTNNFKNWFGDWENDPENASKIVDENGEPMVMYHGSAWEPLMEPKGKAVFRMNDGLLGRGAYFSNELAEATLYAEIATDLDTTEEGNYELLQDKYVTDYFLNVRNEEDIFREGNDMVAVAKSPSQIKSATETTGEFSESDDIRYSSRFDVNTNPTEAQKKAGNYKMGHLRLDGYNITIENPKGSVRRGTDSKGNEWENTLNNDYGYIRGTEGVDGDHIDVYLSDNPAEGNVFVIDQVNPETREFDEHKVMYGFNSMDEAREAYLANFSEGWNGLGTITEVTKDEFRKWIDSSHRKTKPFSEYKSVKAEGAQSEGYEEEDITYSVPSTPTDEIVAEGMKFSIQDFARLAGNIFQDMPESFRKEAIEETFKRGWDMQSAIFQIPARLAEKENWDEADKELAKVIREKVQDAMDESGVVMSRPLTTKEALWMLYRSTGANTDSMLDAAKRAIVAHNLGFDSRSMALKEKADDYIRYSVVRNGQIDAATDMYNYEANLLINRLKESWFDMNKSVIALQNALADASGKPIASWENVELALNQLPSKSYAEKKKYLRDFLMPLWDQIIEMTKVSGLSIEQIERYMMLKHGLERNKKFAKRDAKQFYKEMFDKVADRMKNTSHAEQVVALSEAKKRIADIDNEIATAKGKKLKDLQEARERAVVEKEIAELVLRGDEKQNEQDLQDYYDNIDNELNQKYWEFREKDYGGLTSMFQETLQEVRRKDYKTEEAYQKALMASVKPKYDTVAEMEDAARSEVEAFENGRESLTDELWRRINAATKETLRHQHASGVITTEQYDAVRNMFDFYVPLRGFADNTAEDMYSYYMDNSASGFAKPIIAAKGRKTRAESPLGWIRTMAESGIQQDNKNEAKMKLYYALMNRPDTGVLSLSEMWYEFSHKDPATGKKVFVPVYPPATGKVLSADEMRQHMDAWEQSMKAKQAVGQAYKKEQGVSLGGSVIFQDKTQDAEHIIRVKVAGKDYAILVNGNPRAAQAVNGLLNPDAEENMGLELYKAVQRFVTSGQTSASHNFWFTNFMRDMLMSVPRMHMMYDGKFAAKYAWNRHKAWRVFLYLFRNEKSPLGNSYFEKMYKEFAENGGITGYTVLANNKEYEALFDKYSKEVKSPKLVKFFRALKDGWFSLGEAIEQVSRFAAYITAREDGMPIEESIAAAKEVSVNFNRKGSAKSITRDEIKKLHMKNGLTLKQYFDANVGKVSPKAADAITKAAEGIVMGLSSVPYFGRILYFFFNAGVQSTSSLVRLARQRPGAALSWYGLYGLLGFMMAEIIGALWDDDDEEVYRNLPEYERRNSIMVPIGDGVYLKWAIPQELRTAYGVGDAISQRSAGLSHHLKGRDAVADITDELTDFMPINPFESYGLYPDLLTPIEEIKRNKSGFGSPIYREYAWKSEEEMEHFPKYRLATPKTNPIIVDMTKVLNDATAEHEGEAGWINWNPASIEHLLKGYLGGRYTTAVELYHLGRLLAGKEEFQIKNTPFAKRVLLSTDEVNMNSRTNEAFYHYRGISENAERVENEYRQSDAPSRADDYRKEDDWRIHMLFRQYEEDLKMADEKVKKAVDDTEKDLALQEQNIIREMLLNDIASGKSPDLTTEVRMAIKHLKKKASDDMKPVRDADKKRLERKRAGDLDGMLEAIQLRDSLKAEPRYQRAEAMKDLIKEIEDDMDAIGVAGNASQRDSLLGELQKKYEALMQKAAEEIE